MTSKKGFVLYKSFYDAIEDLTLTQKGMLLDAIFLYQISGEEPSKKSEVYLAFKFIKIQLDIDAEKYTKVIERNRVNGSKGGRPKGSSNKPKKPSGLFRNPKNPGEPKKPVEDEDEDEDEKEKEVENEKNKYTTLQKFINQKSDVIKKVSNKYKDKDVEKAFVNFVEQNRIKDYKYKNYYLAFCKWVREDQFGKYKKNNNSYNVL